MQDLPNLEGVGAVRQWCLLRMRADIRRFTVDDERVFLAQRLFVAMVEARNIDGQKYGEFQCEPIRPDHAWTELKAVAAEAPNWFT